MSKKLTWLDKFAEEQAKKIEKTASKKTAEQIIVDSNEVPEAKTGANVTYKNATYKVVDANYKDEIGNGIVLEKLAEECPNCANGQQCPDCTNGQPCPKCGATPCTCQNVTAAFGEEEVIVPAVVPAMGAPVQKKVTDAPEMARTNPGDAYHIEVRDTTEVQGFEAAANETASNIASENAVDGTTPEGKVNRILQRMQAVPAIIEPAVDEVPVDEAPVDEQAADEVTVDEAPVELEKDENETPEEEAAENETPEEEATEDAEEDKNNKFASNRIFKKIIGNLKK